MENTQTSVSRVKRSERSKCGSASQNIFAASIKRAHCAVPSSIHGIKAPGCVQVNPTLPGRLAPWAVYFSGFLLMMTIHRFPFSSHPNDVKDLSDFSAWHSPAFSAVHKRAHGARDARRVDNRAQI